MKTQRTQSAAGPSSSIGIMRFFDTDTAGPKMSAEFVAVASIAFVALIVLMKWLFFK